MSKTFQVTGMNANNARVKRVVVAVDKKTAIACAKRTQIVHTVIAIKEIKNEQSI